MKKIDAKIYNQSGKETGTIVLPEAVFGLSWNADLVHQVVTSMLTNMRTPVAHTKTRGEVRGGGKKPWRQKGTGRARHGSIRSPLWPGGGITHGPRNDKNFDRKVNKKMKAKALYTILSRKFKDGELLFVDTLSLESAKTKDAKAIVATLAGIKGYEMIAKKRANAAYIALDKKNAKVERGFNNFGNIVVDEVRNLNPLDILNHKYVVITNPEASIKFIESKIASK